MSSHAALIAKLEQAQEGSRALDAAIYKQMPGPRDAWLPHYTTNLQDSVDAVTVECSYIELHIELPMKGCDTVCTAIIRIDNETRHVGTSATAALALSAANVKAMETETAAHE